MSGDVVDKDHKDPYTTTDMVPQYRSDCQPRMSYDGKSTTVVCTQVLSHYIPVQNYHPERWSIQVLDTESDKKHWIPVTETVWDSLDIGDYFTNEED